MSEHLRNFPSIRWENLALNEAADRRRKHNILKSQVTPDLANRLADLSFAYPELSGGVVTGMAQAGIDPLSPEADAIQQRNAQIAEAGITPPPQREGFWDVGLGRGIKGMTRGAFTFFESLYDEVVKGGAAFFTGLGEGKGFREAAESSFGFSTGALALANLRQGKPVNLGSGFFAGGDLSPETQAALDQGVPFREAIANESQMELGLPLRQMQEDFMGRKFQKVPGTENVIDERTGQMGLPVTPGRVVAANVVEPGTRPYNWLSGGLDFAANVFLDPANKLGAGVADLRAANRALVGAGARKTVIARNVDDWLGSSHGNRTAQFIADTDDYLTLHGLFRKNATESNIDPTFIRELQQTSDTEGVKNLISAISKGGYTGGGQLRQLPAKQSLLGRAFGTSGLAGVIARGMGFSGGAVDIMGLRQAVRVNRSTTSFMGRMAAEVGATALRVDDVAQSVDDFGQWLQAAGFAPDRISHYMGEMAAIRRDSVAAAPEMWGLVKGAYKELSQKFINDGISPAIANEFTRAFDTLDDYRKFWISEAGNPKMHAGGEFKVMMNNQLHALPSAQLFSEFMDFAIPLLDMRKIRKGLNRSAWAKAGFEDLARKKLAGGLEKGKALPRFRIEDMDGFDDLGPNVISSLVNSAVQKVWKPLVLLRVAWPVRVIAEEQVRMMATGLDSLWNHPLKAMMTMTGNRAYLDALGNSFDEAVKFRAGLSKRGMEFGLGTPRSMFKDEWLKVDQNDPRYWEGLAIELQQLADDPLTRRIAQELRDADEAAPVSDILRKIKDEFADDSTELGRMRIALARDSSNWRIVNFREGSDQVIDERFIRLIQKTGGDGVHANHINGKYEDLYGNVLEYVPDRDVYRNPVSGQEFQLPEPPRQRGAIDARVAPEELNRVQSLLEPRFAQANAYRSTSIGDEVFEFESVDDVFDLADDLDDLDRVLVGMDDGRLGADWPDDRLYDYHGVNPTRVAHFLRDNAEELALPGSPLIGELAEDLDAVQRVLRDGKALGRHALDDSGRADFRALDLMELAGNREAIMARYAGYKPLPGQPTLEELADKQAWTIEEVKNMISGDMRFDRYIVKPVADDLRAQLFPTGTERNVIWTTPLFEDAPHRGEVIRIGHEGYQTGHIAIQRAPDGRIEDVQMFAVAKGDDRIVFRNRAQEDLGGIAVTENFSVPGERTDAYRLMEYILKGGDGTREFDPSDVMDLAFGGVPMRDWLRSAGFEPGRVGGEKVIPVPDEGLVFHVTDKRYAGNISEEGLKTGGAYGTLEEAQQWLDEDTAITVFRRRQLDPDDQVAPGQTIFNYPEGAIPPKDEWPRPLAVIDESSNARITDDGLAITETSAEPALTLNEMAEFMRQQYGAAWSGEMGPLGQLPAIALSNDGARSLANMMIRMGRGDSRMFKEDMSKIAAAWPQQHLTAQATRAPINELLNAVADGELRLGDSKSILTFREALDDADRVDRISKSARLLRDNLTDRMSDLPNYGKVAAPEDVGRLDRAIDHLFDMFMSVPTNKMSRAPAFKQFYWKRISELLPYMDDATKAKAIKAAREAGVGRGDLRSMVKSAFTGRDLTEEALERLADDFVKGRFATATGDITDLAQADEIAKAFALQETKRLLYDLSKKTQFFDMTRNIFPFGEAWYEIVTTWLRLFNENPRLIRRLQQGLEGARQEGFFYNDPATGEEVFAMPHLEFMAKLMGASEPGDMAQPKFTGRVEGVNLLLNNYLPGLGPVVQMPAATFAQDLFDKPELRFLRDLVFPYGYPDTGDPGAVVNSVMPAWFRKFLTWAGKPTGDDERLYNNTVIDVLRAMELNGEVPEGMSPAQRAEVMETARSRARQLFLIRSAQQFVGPTGAQIRWDVDYDPSGEALAYQALATEYRQILEANEGDRTQAFFDFVNQFGFEPASIITAKTEQLRPRSVTQEGQDFQVANPDLFRDFGLTAYYVAPDPPDGQFDYNAYLSQLRTGDRVPVTPEQWLTERNRLLGNVAYEKVRRTTVAMGTRNDPVVSGWLRAYRYHLMQEYPGFGFANVGVVTQPEQRQFMLEFERWRTDPRMSRTPAGQGLAEYLTHRDRALALAEAEFGISEEGFASAKSTQQLRQFLLNAGYSISKRYPDFATIFQRHYLWEVEDPEPVAPTQLAGVDLTAEA